MQTKNINNELLNSIDLCICPYQGLQAFSEETARYFYGRENLTQEIIQKLEKKSFVAIVGSAGSGKSSLLQAGVIAQLRQGKQLLGSEDWCLMSFLPGSNPLEALSLCLVDQQPEIEQFSPHQYLQEILEEGTGLENWVNQRPEPKVVLIVDQFEELFTLTTIEERVKFISIILAALAKLPEKLKLIIVINIDFITPCLEIIKLAKLLQEATIFLPSILTQEEYQRIIIRPAEQVGLQVEPELVEVLLQELNDAAGYLPLLEFVLQQLWEYRETGVITLQAYQQQLGEIKGALEKKVQAVYESLEPETQECAKWIFLTLIKLGEGQEFTRRRIEKSELTVNKYPMGLVERTLQILTAAKLIVETGNQGQETVEVVHEVLIHHWSTLRAWLEENRSRSRSLRQIEQAATLWQQNHRQADLLLNGVQLAAAEEIYLNYTDELSLDVQNFMAASLQARRKQQQQEQNRLRQAQKTVAMISTLGLTAFGLAVFAYQQTQKAQLQEIQALNSLSENYLQSHQQLEALLTSVKAGKEVQKINFGLPLDVRNQTANILQQTVYSTQEHNRLVHNALVTSVSFSPDGETVASGCADNTIYLWRKDGKLLNRLTDHTDRVNSVVFSPDGQILASASADGTIKLRHRSGKLLHTLTGHQGAVNSISFSPNSQILISGSTDHTVKLWSRDGNLILNLTGHKAAVNAVGFSPEGDTIASAADDGLIKLWSLDGRLLTNLPTKSKLVRSINFSPDGQTIASVGADQIVKLWTRDGTLLRTLEQHREGVWRVIFSPDGQIIATAGEDQTITLWSRDGHVLGTLLGHNHAVKSISFSPDSQMLASASDDKTVRLWKINKIIPKTFYGHQGSVNIVNFTNDHDVITSLSSDSTMKLWHVDGRLIQSLSFPVPNTTNISFTSDRQTVALASVTQGIQIRHQDGRLLHTLASPGQWVTSLSFSPDNQLLAVGSADKTIKIWSVDGRLLHTFSGHDGWVTDVKFSPDGKNIISASADKTIKIWTLDGKLLNTLRGHSASVWSVNIAPDGQTIASASEDTTVKLWDLNGELLHTLQGHTDLVFQVNFSPDSKTLASASDDGTIKLWQIASGTLLTTFSGHHSGVKSVSFSPNGKLLVSGGRDATVKLWNLERIELQTLDVDQLLNRACDRLSNYLTTNPSVTTEEYQLCFGD